MRAIVVLAAFVAAGCLPHSDYHCSTNTDCGGSGTCEPVGFCAFPDSTCTGGSRFGAGAGTYENQCVGQGGIDGGIDTPLAIDAPVGGCPINYTPLNGAQPTHRYRRMGSNSDWATQQAACASAGANVYLTIPDDDAELTALGGLVGSSQFWVGISDIATENTFLTVKGTPAVFLPWTPGAPDNAGPGGQDCVAGITATSKIDDIRCSSMLRTVCECEP